MFTRSRVKSLSSELKKEFEAIGKKHGIVLDFGTVTYGDDQMRFKLNITEKDNGNARPPSAKVLASALWNNHAEAKGLKQSDFGKKFKMKNSTYTIVGIKPRATVNCVIVETNRGARYVMSADAVKRHI